MDLSKVKYLFTDIDDTLTLHGQLPHDSYKALWDLKEAGIEIIPITGRPAGWCEMIARMWPVKAIVGENGAFYFHYTDKKMHRSYFCDEATRLQNQKKLEAIKQEVLKEVPGTAVASDQFCRLFDLAIDFCEDVEPLPKSDVLKIADIYKKHGAVAKISSIHVNGWYGDYDKLSCCKDYCKDVLGFDIAEKQSEIAFIGDSPNDEPMFGFFDNSFGVSNISQFLDQLKTPPKTVLKGDGSHGFCELTEMLLKK